MRKLILLFVIALSFRHAHATAIDTAFVTPFERSSGKQTATYAEVMEFYKMLAAGYSTIGAGEMGPADNGYPMRYYAFTNDGKLDWDEIRNSGKLVILINNAIHAGEPDGVDACMMLMRDMANGKIKAPDNVVIIVIPAYNIGGMMNRSSSSRANQNGPESYGFRGSARNLDLNRDFIKCDAAETLGLEDLIARMNPDIFVDNHVSDGADYQHVMTLIETQHDKLGGKTGAFMHNILTPQLYKEMKTKGYDMAPYVNDFSNTPDNGWKEFYDSPRYSTGYAALFQTIGYVPETHMLKPYKDRVMATYALMQCMIKAGSEHAADIKKVRADDKKALMTQDVFALDWTVDTTRYDTVIFKGYTAGYKPSEVSGLPRLYYDRSRPYTKKVPYYNHFTPNNEVKAPRAYIIPKAWTPVILCFRNSGVKMQRVNYDSVMEVTAYHIDEYQTTAHPYEKHYLHYNIKATPYKTHIQVTQGDYIIWLAQPAKRYIVETLEPTAPDGFLAWNFFDGILQQKEGYSAYVFEDLAAEILKQNPSLKQQLEEKRKSDPEFAKSADAQLNFVYRHSAYFEKEYMRYPVFRLE